MIDPDTRRLLRRCGRKVASWTAERDAAIVDAYDEGASLREIGEACGLHYTSVRKIVLRSRS